MHRLKYASERDSKFNVQQQRRKMTSDNVIQVRLWLRVCRRSNHSDMYIEQIYNSAFSQAVRQTPQDTTPATPPPMSNRM